MLRSNHWPAPSDYSAPTELALSCRSFLLQGLIGLRLDPAHPMSTADGLALLGALSALAGLRFTESTSPQSITTAATRLVPFYLPQFHPTEKNNRWWGPGFTEWTNTTSAEPQFAGHWQPRHPADLGHYDLRVDEVRRQQQELAQRAGIAAFMYYHYWFAGERLLDLPLDRMIADPGMALPFCIMWANENWTRSWNGSAEILMAQDYDTVPADRFLNDLIPYLRDPRYFEIDARKVVSVYRPGSIPQFPRVAEAWRKTAADAGIELFILGVEYATMTEDDARALDGLMAFPPHGKAYVDAPLTTIRPRRGFRGLLMSYQGMVDADIEALQNIAPDYFPGVMPGWDNTARRGVAAHIWVGENPYTYHHWLLTACEAVSERPSEHRVVFINAWNEWAESAVLEPSRQFGASYLGATRDVANG